jgi:hypothetical protein
VRLMGNYENFIKSNERNFMVYPIIFELPFFFSFYVFVSLLECNFQNGKRSLLCANRLSHVGRVPSSF